MFATKKAATVPHLARVTSLNTVPAILMSVVPINLVKVAFLEVDPFLKVYKSRRFAAENLEPMTAHTSNIF